MVVIVSQFYRTVVKRVDLNFADCSNRGVLDFQISSAKALLHPVEQPPPPSLRVYELAGRADTRIMG